MPDQSSQLVRIIARRCPEPVGPDQRVITWIHPCANDVIQFVCSLRGHARNQNDGVLVVIVPSYFSGKGGVRVVQYPGRQRPRATFIRIAEIELGIQVSDRAVQEIRAGTRPDRVIPI